MTRIVNVKRIKDEKETIRISRDSWERLIAQGQHVDTYDVLGVQFTEKDGDDNVIISIEFDDNREMVTGESLKNS